MEYRSFEIEGRKVGIGAPCLVVGEVAQAHDGSLGTAHAFIDAIASAGAGAVKFQTHIASAESSPLEPFRVHFSSQDATRFDYWKRMEFTPEQWAGLAQHARERGLIFLSSPFSEAAVDLLAGLGMSAWKIASGEVNNPLLMERIFRTGRPVLLSTGMSAFAEIDKAVEQIRARELPYMVLQATSKYPTPPEEVGLNLLSYFHGRYQCPVGLSDHSGQIYAGLAAAALGASLIEVHVTLSREMFGPDVPASLTTTELRQLVEGVRAIETMLAHPVNKDQVVEGLESMRTTFGKSLVAAADLKAGQALTREVLTAKKPGWGIPAHQFEAVLGRRLRRDLAQGEFLSEEDLEEKE
jgi:N,N'-diacetyllegionaminate synthase